MNAAAGPPRGPLGPRHPLRGPLGPRAPLRGPLGPRLLIVNADDYGLTERISSGILRGHREGIVTSTSVLALGPAYPKVSPWLEDVPTLGVGVHLAAVGEDPPLLAAAEIPTLVDHRGHLHHSYKGLLVRMLAGRVDPDDLRREFTAQLESVLELGVPIGHLDAHQHLHLWPAVGAVVLALACRYDIPAVRVPHYRGVSPLAVGVTVLGRHLASRARAVGLRYPRDGTGIEVSGKLDHANLQTILVRLAAHGAPSLELTVHPGEPDDPDRHRYDWDYHWADELDALTSEAAHRTVTRLGFTLATYADLPVPTDISK
ncbi:MAG: ChbG/HpnK family deacetylase [Acidimicrobiales bacterium]